jgi:hypothetical protein
MKKTFPPPRTKKYDFTISIKTKSNPKQKAYHHALQVPSFHFNRTPLWILSRHFFPSYGRPRIAQQSWVRERRTLTSGGGSWAPDSPRVAQLESWRTWTRSRRHVGDEDGVHWARQGHVWPTVSNLQGTSWSCVMIAPPCWILAATKAIPRLDVL